MTSEESIETVERAIDAWNRGDAEGFLAAWHPDCEWRPAFPKGTEGTGGVFQGSDGIRTAWDNVRAVWSVYRVEPQDVRWVGDELLVLGRVVVRGQTSGVKIDSDWSAILRFQDGKILTAWDWLAHAPALVAVGLQSTSGWRLYLPWSSANIRSYDRLHPVPEVRARDRRRGTLEAG